MVNIRGREQFLSAALDIASLKLVVLSLILISCLCKFFILHRSCSIYEQPLKLHLSQPGHPLIILAAEPAYEQFFVKVCQEAIDEEQRQEIIFEVLWHNDQVKDAFTPVIDVKVQVRLVAKHY